jgi:aminopeptidase-like protein
MSVTEGSPDREIGEEIYALAAQIFPICRSITGNGVRETLDILARHIPLQKHEVPTATRVFDWEVPREWNIADAWIKNERGERVVDFRASNLHVLSYSIPIRATMSLAELRPHIFTLPDQPDLIPYRTSYYAERWGFCMAHSRFLALEEGAYEVCIASRLEDGHLTYGEYLHKGACDDEVLLSAHICHPSLADDNCSGLALLALLGERLKGRRTHYSYRFLFAPGTIGSITWLARNEERAQHIKHGLVISCVGDGGGPTYKRSRQGDAMIDRAMSHVLSHAASAPRTIDFFPYGYDERQYCSPGFNLPVGLFQRSQFATFPEYHTSADNLDFIKPEHLAASYAMIWSAIDIIETNRRHLNLAPKCEPQLGRRGLYGSLGGDNDGQAKAMALLWVLNMSDGEHDLLSIAERAGMQFAPIADAAARLTEAGLLKGAGG